jgi:Tol biopolymer transport system component
MAVRFDLDRLQPTGIPIAVLDRVGIEGGLMQLGVSDTGTVVYLPEVPGEESKLVLVDREGTARPLIKNSLPYSFPNDPRFSPDGSKLVNSSALGPIWVLDLESETPTRISEQGFYPLWSRDGSTVFYGTTRGESFDLWKRRVDMSSAETMILDQENNLRTGEMAPDGALIFREEIPGRGMDLMRWPDLDDPSSITPLLASPANELSPAVSPDGRWIAYVSDDSGRDEVFVTSYPVPGGHVQISTSGATSPAWSPDSRELYYFEKDRFIAVRVEADPGFRVVEREVLFAGNFSQYRWQRQYDVHPAGDRFVMVESPAGGEVEIVINWFVELERLLPSDAS